MLPYLSNLLCPTKSVIFMTLESDRGAPELSRLTDLELVAKPNVAYCGVLPAGWSPMDAERLFIEEIGAIIARLEMQTEQLSLHVEGLKNHTYKGEVARENARLKEMLRQLHCLKKLKELYDATRVTNPISHLPH